MGNLPTAILPSLILPVEHYVSELPEVDRPLKNLGSTRFFKVVRGRHTEGPVVVKVLVKHDPNLALKHHQEQLSLIRDILGPIPNLLPFSIWRDSDRAAFLIRPFVRYSLSERMFSLPSLEPLEKRWIVFQLLTALSSCHELGVSCSLCCRGLSLVQQETFKFVLIILCK